MGSKFFGNKNDNKETNGKRLSKSSNKNSKKNFNSKLQSKGVGKAKMTGVRKDASCGPPACNPSCVQCTL